MTSMIGSTLLLAWLPWFLAPDFAPEKAVNLQVRVYAQGADHRGEQDRVIVCTCDRYSDSAIGFDYIGLHLSYQREGHRVTARLQPEMQCGKNSSLRFVTCSDWIGGGTKWEWQTKRRWFHPYGNECKEFRPAWNKPCELLFRSEEGEELRVALPSGRALYSVCPGLDLHAMWSGRKLMISGPAAGEFVFEMEEVKRSFSRGALDGVTVLTHGEHRFKLTSVQ